jgi:hypothetical protein
VSALVHANKMVEISRERGPSSIPTDFLTVYEALNSMTDPTYARIPYSFSRAEKLVLVYEKLSSPSPL